MKGSDGPFWVALTKGSDACLCWAALTNGSEVGFSLVRFAASTKGSSIAC